MPLGRGYLDGVFALTIKRVIMKKKLIVVNLREVFDYGINMPFGMLAKVEDALSETKAGQGVNVKWNDSCYVFDFQHFQIDIDGTFVWKLKFKGSKTPF